MFKYLCALALGVSTLAATKAHAAASCTIGIGAELPVVMRGLRPMVTAQVNGADVQFLADSGAFYSAVTRATAAALKLPGRGPSLTIQGASGTAQASVAAVKAFTLAGRDLSNLEFLVTQSIGDDAGGMLGQNILGIADVEYDFANSMIRLLWPKGCGQDDALAYWAKNGNYGVINIRPSTPREPHTVGTVEVNGVRLTALFDTGAGVSTMSRAAAARLGIKPETPGVVDLGIGGGGLGSKPLHSWVAPVASFKIADEEIKNTRLRFSDADLIDSDMLIGADFFLSHRVYVSKQQKRLYLTYNGGRVFDLTSPATAPSTPGPAPGQAPEAKAPVTTVAKAELSGGAEAYAQRGAVAEARGDLPAAIADFSKAVELKPDEPSYLFRRAVAYAQTGKLDLAEADLDRALKLDPSHLGSLTTRASLRLRKRDRPAAKADIDAAALAAGKDADMRLRLAELYTSADEFESAIAQYDLWLLSHQRDPQRAVALNGRCWSRALWGRDLQNALDDCNRALGVTRAAYILDSRGLVQLRLGAFDKAIADYNAVLKVRPKEAWSLYGRGMAKLAKGLTAEGEADLAAAAKLAPDLAKKAEGYGIRRP